MSAATRRSRLLGALVAAGLAAALAACAGIPTTGPVIAGPAVDEIDPEFVITPNGPVAGADPNGILSGFMLAVRAPQADYQVARQFLTPELARTWDPNAGVLIRSAAPVLAAAGEESSPVVEYAFASGASVDGAGRYRSTAVDTVRSLEFSFVQVDGQWRISAAPDGIVLTPSSFERAFRSYALYFFDPSGRYLVPDVRWFAVRPSTPSIVVGALLAGPDEWLSHSVVSDFPDGTTLGPGSVVTTSGRASVDLSAQAAAASPRELGRMHQQLVATLDIADVAITADGVPLRVVPTGAPAVIDPQPTGTTLLGSAAEFGHAGAAGVEPVPGISEALVADGAVSATLTADQEVAVYLAGDGVVRRVANGASSVIDTRPGLVAPSLDGFGWTWSGGGPSPLDAFDPRGGAAALAPGGLPADAVVTALAVSRDSTRIVVAVESPLGPRLLVYGIVRVDGAPVSLDPPLELPVSGPVASVAWVDDRSLVVVEGTDIASEARVVRLGGPGESLGELPTGAVAVGGRGGIPGIRALANGRVLLPSGAGGWTDTGFVASYLGTQQ